MEKSTTKIIIEVFVGISFIIETLANFDGAIGFINKIGINVQMNTLISIAKGLSGIIHFLMPFLFLYLLYKYIQLKDKLKALKKYRDYETIRIINHYNDMFKNIHFKLGNKDLNTPLDKTQIENLRYFGEKTSEYNKEFEDWKMGNYTIDEILTSIDKANIQ